jgi:glycosyltransferase involved in cell wall biosynthesis
MKICVLIPTYNEAREISGLIREIRGQGLEVLVVDDGSTDKTAEIAKESGAQVFKNKNNEGKGASLAKGFRYALDRGYDAVITMDGDGQHLPEDIPRFIDLARTPENEVLIGNRMQATKTMPWVRIMTNIFMSWLLSAMTRQAIPDTQCGFRLIKKETLANLDLRSDKYEIESEMLIRASRLGKKIVSVPIKTVYRSEVSRINPFTDTLRFFRFVIKELWTSRR